MDDKQKDLVMDKIIKMMDKDGLPLDERYESNLIPYRDQIVADCGIDEEEAIMIVFETVLLRKMKNSDIYKFLQGTGFGKGSD